MIEKKFHATKSDKFLLAVIHVSMCTRGEANLDNC